MRVGRAATPRPPVEVVVELGERDGGALRPFDLGGSLGGEGGHGQGHGHPVIPVGADGGTRQGGAALDDEPIGAGGNDLVRVAGVNPPDCHQRQGSPCRNGLHGRAG